MFFFTALNFVCISDYCLISVVARYRILHG